MQRVRLAHPTLEIVASINWFVTGELVDRCNEFGEERGEVVRWAASDLMSTIPLPAN
jgi:hypothetical protein